MSLTSNKIIIFFRHSITGLLSTNNGHTRLVKIPKIITTMKFNYEAYFPCPMFGLYTVKQNVLSNLIVLW